MVTQEESGCPYRILYTVSAVISACYAFFMTSLVLVLINMHNLTWEIVGAIMLLACVFDFALQIVGIITTFMDKSKATCMINFAKISYWIIFIFSILLGVGAFVLYLITQNEIDKRVQLFVFLIVCLGITFTGICWSIYIFALFPEVRTRTLFLPPRYQQLVYVPHYSP